MTLGEIAMPEDQTQQCPFCKEQINPKATKCKCCGSHLEPTRPEHGGQCPYCKESIHPDAIVCKHCKSTLQAAKDCGCSRQHGFTLSAPNLTAFSGANSPVTFMNRARPGGNTGQAGGSCYTYCDGPTLVCVCSKYVPGIGVVTSIFPCGSCINDPIAAFPSTPVM